jgi:hypothetical protein
MFVLLVFSLFVLLVFGHWLGDSFCTNFQDLEAKDFEQQKGKRGKFHRPCCHTLILYFCLHAVKLNLIFHTSPCFILRNLVHGGVSG